MALKVGELFASFDLDASGMNGTIRTIESSLEGIGASMVQVGSSMQSALSAPLMNLGKSALDAGMDFTAQMSTVKAISGATAAQMEQLNAKALEMGSTTKFTATQAGEALEYMAMAGWKPNQMLAGLAPIMNLAAASGEDLATTSDIVTDALTAFGLTAEDAGHFSDILAVASSSANTNVSMMGETFKYVAPVAGALGYKAEDVAVAIGIMANSGIKAGQAGTVLRASLSKLASPTAEAQKYLNKIGLSITDTKGEIKPFNELVKDMRTSFSKLTRAQQTQYAAEIFGQEAMSGMLAVINASDEDIEKLTKSIENCDGATKRMADTVLANAKGDLTLFKSAVEGAQVALFKLNEDAIRGVIQSGTKLVERFNAADDKTKQLALKVGLLAAAMGPAIMFGGKLVLTLSRIGVILGALVSPIGLVAAGLGLFAVAAVDAQNEIGDAFVSISKAAKKQLGKVDKHLKKAISTVSARMPALIQSVIAGTQAALPQLTSTAVNIVSYLARAIGDNASGIFDIGITIIESIVKGIARSLPNIVTAGAHLVTGLINAFTSGKLGNAVSSMIGEIKNGFAKVDWKATGTQIVASISGALTSLRTGIEEKFKAAKKAVEEIKWSEISDKIKGGISIASGWLKGLILGDALTDESTWKDCGKKIWGWIRGSFSAAEDWLKGLILGDTMTDESTWKDVGVKIWGWIKSGFSAAKGWLSDLIFGAEGEDGGLSGLKDKIVSTISTVLSQITPEELSAKIGDLSAVAVGIIDKIISSEADFAAKAGELIKKLVEGLNGFTGWDSLGDSVKTVASGLIGSIVSAIGKVTGAASDVAGAIGGVLSGITMADVSDAVSGVAGVLIDGIVAGIKGVVTGAADIAWAIAAVIGNIQKSDFGTSIGTLAADLFGMIVDGIAEITTTPDMSAFVASIGRGIESSMALLGDIAGTIVGYILSKEGIASIVNAGAGIAGAIAQGIGEGLKGLSAGIFNVFTSILSGVIESVLSWFGIEKDLMVEAMNDMTFTDVNGESITGRMLDRMIGGTNEIESRASTIYEQAQAYVALVQAGFVDQCSQADFSAAGVALAAKLQEGFFAGDPQTEARAMAALIVSGMGDGFSEYDYDLYLRGCEAIEQYYNGVSEGTDVVTPLLAALGIEIPQTMIDSIGSADYTPAAAAMSDGLGTVVDAAASLAQQGSELISQSTARGAASGIVTGMTNAEESVRTSAETMAQIVTGANDLTNIESDAKTTGETAGKGIGTGVSNESGSAQSSVDALVADMNTAYQPLIADFAYTTQEAMIAANRALLLQMPHNVAVMTHAANAIIAAAKAILSRSAGYSLGHDVMQGIIDAISAMSGMLSSVAGRAVSGAIAAMRRAADAHSPSRKSMALGEDIDEGAAIGLSGGLMVKAAIQSVEDTIAAFTREVSLGDLSAGTVRTARQSARDVASETIDRLQKGGDSDEFAHRVGTAMADRLIESGALEGDVYYDSTKVGRKLHKPVSQEISRDSKKTVRGRSAQGVII